MTLVSPCQIITSKISRRIDQFGSCVLLLKNFKVDLDQLSLQRKFDFNTPTARYDLDSNLDHPLASIIMQSSCNHPLPNRFIHTDDPQV